MTVRQLIAALHACPPDADVFFADDNDVRLPVEGGIKALNRATGRQIVTLAPISLDQVGGF